MLTYTQSRQTQQIRERIDLASLVREYVTLKPAGTNTLKGLCPFHKEKTPSFTVSTSRHLYHCHGCGVGGDAYQFLMRIEGIGFTEARRSLAERAGVSLDVAYADTRAMRRQQVYVDGLAREAAVWWRWLRRSLVEMETVCYEWQRRAERYLRYWLDRGDFPDTPKVEYAWFWLHRGEQMALHWRAEIDEIDGAEAMELIQVYGWMARQRPGVREWARREIEADARVNRMIEEAWGLT